MNMITLNGVQSTDCKGLLIQSLPPITKPLIRTQVEEIDGRDGDIVTKLGYAAYDKEVTIGLYGDYNVDDVIAFFDSEGTVIFSNEPDKYYNYQIIEQIDFERLLRFKTATVIFHCQPFKYSAVDQTFVLNNSYMEVDDFSETTNGVTVSVDDGVITIEGTATASTEFYIPVDVSLDSGTYILSADSEGTIAGEIRLINGSTADSFSDDAITLEDGTVTIEDTLTADKTYNYLYVMIPLNAEVDFTADVLLLSNATSITVFNRGNTVSKPTITLDGEGTVILSLNGIQIFTIVLATTIIINVAEMNAYDSDGNLMNRYISGDYDNFELPIGTNTISWSGTVTNIEVDNFTRWI